MSSPLPGVYVFDMGQNFSGWARLRVQGPRGTDVRLRFAELLYENGTLNQENLRSAQAEDHYILKGEGEETWEPRFTYHGFRYVEVSGFPGTPQLDTLRGRVVHTAVEPIGSFAASKDILNGLQRIITWGQKTNLHGVPTDCDQRDERMGWMGDAQGTAEEAILNFDMAAFYTNFVRDIRDVQDEKGRLSDTVPHVWGGENSDPAWATAYPLLCWYMYQYYGDVRVLEEHYDAMKKYVEFLRSKAENGLVKFSSYGDWVAVEKCPGAIVSSFYYYYDVRIQADAARVLGKTQDAALYDKLAAEIRTAFNKEYYNPEDRRLRRRHPDGQHPAPLPGHPDGTGGQRRRPALRRRRLQARLSPDDGHHRHQVHHGGPDPERERRPGLRHRRQDRLSELGLHDQERRDDALGAVAEARRPVHELAQPPHVRQRRVVALQGPGRDRAGPGDDGLRDDPHPAPDGPRPDPRLGLDPDRARRDRLRLVADRADRPGRGHGARSGRRPRSSSPSSGSATSR